MKNRNTTATCAKATGGELRAERDLCCFPSFYLGIQQVPVMAFQCSHKTWHIQQVPVGVCLLGNVVSRPLTG